VGGGRWWWQQWQMTCHPQKRAHLLVFEGGGKCASSVTRFEGYGGANTSSRCGGSGKQHATLKNEHVRLF
jgi:hypothetical protein